MTLKQVRLSLIAVALLVAMVALATCGKKGDPIRPGDEPRDEKSITEPLG